MQYNVKILEEHGYHSALTGLSLSYNKPVHEMKKVADSLYNKNKGHNKFLESICVWLDITMPRYWWSEMDCYRVGMTKQSECYDDKTEVLTNNGWKFFKDLSIIDKFYTMCPSTGNVEIQEKTEYIESDYKGEMVSLKSKKFDLLVTPNHDIPTVGRDNNTIMVKASNFKYTHKIPKNLFNLKQFDSDEINFFTLPKLVKKWDTGYRKCEKVWEEKKVKMDDWLAFFGFWLAEGRIEQNKRNYNTYVYQKNTDKCYEDLIELLDRLPFTYNVFDKGDGNKKFTISDKQLYNYLSSIGNTYTKYIPRQFLSLSERQSNILLEWMMLGDGTENKENSTYLYSTVSRKLANDTQELMLRCGYVSNIYKRTDNPKATTPLYTVNRSETKTYRLQKENITREHYSGKIYCVEVPNHIIFVRRNGKSTWSGNSTMHTIFKQKLAQDDFVEPIYTGTLNNLNFNIDWYNQSTTRDSKDYWLRQIKRNLPEGFLQRRIVCTNYKVLRHIIEQRKNHRLKEWQKFCKYLQENAKYKEWLV